MAATRLSLLHASTMERLAAKSELWIHTARTDYRGDEIEAWIRQPPGNTDSWLLVHATRDAHSALENAVTQLVKATPAGLSLSGGWPPRHLAEPANRQVKPARPHATQRPHLDVGR